ncbi:MAG TPA: hypothetical protein VL134_08490 [Leptolyngbya sp.]|jgi:hypothetical protein|nr:hypothetical protein [Leptolyngbya sp.]
MLEKQDHIDSIITHIAMLQTFKAVLKGNLIEWLDEAPQLGDQSISVHITVLETVLEESVSLDSATRGQRMAEVLEKLAANRSFSDIDPLDWQREVRHERPMPGRNE